MGGEGLSEGIGRPAPAFAEVVPAFAICWAEPGRRFRPRSRDGADHVGAHLTELAVALATVPRAFRTGTCFWSRPTVSTASLWVVMNRLLPSTDQAIYKFGDWLLVGPLVISNSRRRRSLRRL
jgi:hypothetical protein